MSDIENLHQNDLGDVRPCDCGGINVSLGPVTLHVAADEVDAFFELACVAKDLADDARRRSAKKRRGRGKDKAHTTLH